MCFRWVRKVGRSPLFLRNQEFGIWSRGPGVRTFDPTDEASIPGVTILATTPTRY
jgi:hypothetical protein